jgi:hypothetical protein
MNFKTALLSVLAPLTTFGVEPKFEAQTIDPKIEIGYGLAIGDVDGDGKPDILLADKSQIAWYHNGDWKRHVIAENLNPRVGTRFLDNVCLAARDIDGDGKVEIAVGANWNPGETTNAEASGSVHFLVRPEDPTQRWTPVKLHHEPTVHRMHWIQLGEQDYRLVVLPLHGRGNANGEGDGAKLLAYSPPHDPSDAAAWKTEVVDDSMHLTHNFDLIPPDSGETESILLGGKEGVKRIRYVDGNWKADPLLTATPSGEVRDAGPWVALVSPMHGNSLRVASGPGADEIVLDDSLAEGHALAIADLLGTGNPQIVAGWRNPDKAGKTGIRLYVPDGGGKSWTPHLIDDNTMACEDLKIADLDHDGRPDLIAAGRASHNVTIYWNKSK